MPHDYDHKYTYSQIDYNLKLIDTQAAVGVAHPQKLPEFIETRRRNFRRPHEGLSDLQEYLILPEATPGSHPSWGLASRPGLIFPEPMSNPLAADLDLILEHTESLWNELRGQRLFITGGTGFFGRWLLESLIWANDRLCLQLQAVVLSRKPEAFIRKAPHLAHHECLRLIQGDVCDFAFPEGSFSHVIHAATEACVRLNADAPLRMIDTIVSGTRRVLDFAQERNVGKLLLTSSGAVYGRQPPELPHISEDYLGGPDCTNPLSAYGEGKRLAELLCSIYSRQHGIACKIARCFAFVGPHLPFDKHFAVGNFVRDGLGDGPIRVGGDGTSYRSYLYAADLAIWLWTILVRGKSVHPYNVGSAEAVSIAQLADEVARCFTPSRVVQIAHLPEPGRPAERYVPSVDRTITELGLKVQISLREALLRTIRWASR